MNVLSSVSLNAVRAFEATARYGGIGQAANALNVSHSAISRQVKLLEQSLGVTLLTGSRRMPRLTLEGQRLAAELQKGFDTLEAALSKAIAQQTHSLDVGCLPSFATRTLIPRLHRLYALAPSVEVKIVTNQRRLQLEQSRYDVQIMALPPQKKRQANDVLLMTERLGLVLSPALNARQSGCENLLANISLLLARSRLDVWAELQAASALTLGSYQGTVEYEHYHFVLDAVLAGLGFCIAPQHLVEQDLHSGRLLAPFGFYDSGYVYVARHSAQPSPAVMQFCAWLREELAVLMV